MHRHERVAPVVPGEPVIAGPADRLEPDAIGVGQDIARFVWRSPFFHVTREATGAHDSAVAGT